MFGDTLVPLSDKTLAFGELFADAILGVDALDRKLFADPDDEDYDGVACINLGWNSTATYNDWDEARAALQELASKALSLRLSKNDTLEFSHTLDTILGLLTQKGFAVTGFYTDSAGSEPTDSFVHDSHLHITSLLTTNPKVNCHIAARCGNEGNLHSHVLEINRFDDFRLYGPHPLYECRPKGIAAAR